MIIANRIRKKPKSVPVLPPAIPPLPVLRFTVDEYHRLVEAGVLTDRKPYELIHGWIVFKMGINPPHAYAVNVLNDIFGRLRGPHACVRIQQPITTDDSEPEPDVAIAAGATTDYSKRHPAPEEIHLLVEVADSSLREDRTTKLKMYAEAGIREYWIVNLINRRVEVYTGPRGGAKPSYRKRKYYAAGVDVTLGIDGKEMGRIPVNDLLA